MGKGEIARYKQFLLFPQCFQKACFPGASKGVVVWEWVKGFSGWGATIREGAFIRRNTVLIIVFCVLPVFGWGSEVAQGYSHTKN